KQMSPGEAETSIEGLKPSARNLSCYGLAGFEVGPFRLDRLDYRNLLIVESNHEDSGHVCHHWNTVAFRIDIRLVDVEHEMTTRLRANGCVGRERHSGDNPERRHVDCFAAICFHSLSFLPLVIVDLQRHPRPLLRPDLRCYRLQGISPEKVAER